MGFGLKKIPHYHAAMSCARWRQDPWQRDGAMPVDFRFAAEQTAARIENFRETRQRSKGLLRELSARTKGLSAALRAQQSLNVRQSQGNWPLA